MTEEIYINISDFARLRVASDILRECAIFQGDGIKEALRLVENRIHYLFSKEFIEANSTQPANEGD